MKTPGFEGGKMRVLTRVEAKAEAAGRGVRVGVTSEARREALGENARFRRVTRKVTL